MGFLRPVIRQVIHGVPVTDQYGAGPVLAFDEERIMTKKPLAKSAAFFP